jgi:hypothetical protein
VAYDPSIIAAIRREAARVNDPNQRSRFLRAALQTGIVESGLRNLHYGDADSQGWRQERGSLYANPTNVNASVRRFFQEAASLDHGQPSWQLAADVQRPAAQFRGRYHDVAKQAAALLGGGGGSPSSGGGSSGSDQMTDAPVQQALLKLTQPDRPQVQVTAPSLPAFAAGQQQGPTMYQSPQTAAPARPQRLDVGAALEAITALQPQQQAAQTPEAGGASPSRGNPPASGARRAGSFTISGPNPDRLRPHLTSFANKVADQLGMRLVLDDGSSHGKYTTTGNVSDHWAGNATDIFTANGKSLKQHQGLLLQAGRAALIAAGMPPAKARKAPFGLYNVGGHQIIFGTNSKALGGDHTDHLHISAR